MAVSLKFHRPDLQLFMLYFIFYLAVGLNFSLSLWLTKKNNITMESGIVKFFNESKGFGFIKVNGSNQEVFVHVSGLTDQVRENDAVVFELQEGKKALTR